MAFDINEQEFHDKNDEIFKPVSLLSRKAGSFPAALAKALTATTAAAIAAAALISNIHMACTPVSIEENHATFENQCQQLHRRAGLGWVWLDRSASGCPMGR